MDGLYLLKGKVIPVNPMKAYLHSFLTTAQYGGECVTWHSGRFTSWEMTSSTHWLGSWMGSRTGLQVVESNTGPSSPYQQS